MLPLSLLLVEPLINIYQTAESQGGGMGGMMQDLAFAIPGVDEAMGFAEIMKSVVIKSWRLPYAMLTYKL